MAETEYVIYYYLSTELLTVGQSDRTAMAGNYAQSSIPIYVAIMAKGTNVYERGVTLSRQRTWANKSGAVLDSGI